MFPLLLLMLALALASPRQAVRGQAPQNLVQNGDASRGLYGWQPSGFATLEETGDAAHFVVRDKGHFTQIIELPPLAAGQFVTVVGRGASDRINANGSITGLPSVYGMFEERYRVRILGYLQGQQ